MTPESMPSLEDVLDAYALEANNENATLERYLHDYPQYASELVEFSRELDRPQDISTAPLEAADHALIDSGWKQILAATTSTNSDPLLALDPEKMKMVAQALGIPRQILAAFRERRVLVATVPPLFLERLATALGTPWEELRSSLARAPSLTPRPSYKSDEKPDAPQQVAFERLLVDACVPPEQRAILLTNEN